MPTSSAKDPEGSISFATGIELREFTSDKTLAYTGSVIRFAENSGTGATWLWNFGDGETSTLNNPSHIYTSAGVYTVTVTVNSTKIMTKTDFIHILPDKTVPYTLEEGGNFETNPGTYQCALQSPNFNFPQKGGTYTLRFRKSMQDKWAVGAQMQYSTDRGNTWARLGNANDPAGENWYNKSNMTDDRFFADKIGWQMSAADQLTSYDVSFLAGQENVAFRFVFSVVNAYSSSSYESDGFMVDDFEIMHDPIVTTSLINETFNEMPDGWTFIDANNDGKTIGISGGKSVQRFWNANDEWLITPQLALPAGEKITFSYKTQMTPSLQYGNDMDVKLSVGGKDISTDFTVTLDELRDIPIELITVTHDLSEYAGQSVYIGFHFINNTYYHKVDDVRVVAERVAEAPPSFTASLGLENFVQGITGIENTVTAKNQPAGTTSVSFSLIRSDGSTLSTITDTNDVDGWSGVLTMDEAVSDAKIQVKFLDSSDQQIGDALEKTVKVISKPAWLSLDGASAEVINYMNPDSEISHWIESGFYEEDSFHEPNVMINDKGEAYVIFKMRSVADEDPKEKTFVLYKDLSSTDDSFELLDVTEYLGDENNYTWDLSVTLMPDQGKVYALTHENNLQSESVSENAIPFYGGNTVLRGARIGSQIRDTAGHEFSALELPGFKGRAPVVVSPIADIEVEEGASPITLDLDEAFFFDSEGGDVTYSVPDMGYPTGNEVVLPVVQGNLLILSFVDDMSGEQYVSVTAENANCPETTGFTVSVGVVNDGPVLKAIENMTIPEDQETIVELYADDPDSTPDDMVFTAESDNTFISAATEGNQLMLKPEPDWIGTANITITVSDGFSSDSSTFTVAVADMNEMPVIFSAMNAGRRGRIRNQGLISELESEKLSIRLPRSPRPRKSFFMGCPYVLI
ncbi:MAG: hypothetical protein DRI57_12480 [Deltaproteobacteria bacterium]|nr:MAG: hypothetical protein DRI57_12480 [Deltaproteobacteria bacterium]